MSMVKINIFFFHFFFPFGKKAIPGAHPSAKISNLSHSKCKTSTVRILLLFANNNSIFSETPEIRIITGSAQSKTKSFFQSIKMIKSQFCVHPLAVTKPNYCNPLLENVEI